MLALASASVSCVPVSQEGGRAALGLTAPPAAVYTVEPGAEREAAELLARTRNILAARAEGEEGLAYRGRTELDRLRSLDCLAQAVYYEAASESEEGQRAVAQVVLNRVRHPAWPDSVCGVVYQGPMRAGGGCQFTFTCDGSLARPATGVAWVRARAIAAEALAGRVYAPVGQSTHYHTHAVFPSWAPRLQPTLSIGAHAFYRLPGAAGAASAFTDAYAGSEPLLRPSMTLVRLAAAARPVAEPASASAGLASLRTLVPTAPSPSAAIEQSPSPAPSEPAPSTVREEYRHSGQWREDAPAAITGR